MTLESQITGKSGKEILDYPFSQGYVIAPKWRNDSDISVSLIVTNSASMQPHKVLSAVAQLVELTKRVEDHEVLFFRQSPHRTVRGQDILEYLFDTNVNIRASSTAQTLSRAYKAADVKVQKNLTKDLKDDGRMWALMSGASLFENPDLLEKVLVGSQSQLVIKGMASKLIALLRDTEAIDAGTSGMVHEAVVFIDALSNVESECRRAWVYPDVILGEGQNIQNQVDTISVKLFDDHVCVELIECTGEDGDQKAIRDAEKVTKLGSQLRSRFKDPTFKFKTKVIGRSSIQQTFVNIDNIYASHQAKSTSADAAIGVDITTEANK